GGCGASVRAAAPGGAVCSSAWPARRPRPPARPWPPPWPPACPRASRPARPCRAWPWPRAWGPAPRGRAPLPGRPGPRRVLFFSPLVGAETRLRIVAAGSALDGQAEAAGRPLDDAGGVVEVAGVEVLDLLP